VAFPHWSIHKLPPATRTGFTASRGAARRPLTVPSAPTLAELEHELRIAARAGSTGAGVDAGRHPHTEQLAR